ncbi:5-oxoprolinase subunit B family protein [Mariniluteicoccus flavus]
MSLRPCGDRAIMVELADAAERRLLDAALRRDPLPGMVEHVPAAVTVLVRLDLPERVAGAAAALRALDLGAVTADAGPDAEVVEIPVTYDGEDLAHVAELVGLTPEGVVERHTGQLWTVEFAGFMPGFGYLSGETGGLTVPRRDSPRTRIPPGSVALAGDFTGLYPQASPGGWQLIGTTDIVLWDVTRTPPAVLTPGARIRFVDVGSAVGASGAGR